MAAIDEELDEIAAQFNACKVSLQVAQESYFASMEASMASMLRLMDFLRKARAAFDELAMEMPGPEKPWSYKRRRFEAAYEDLVHGTITGQEPLL